MPTISLTKVLLDNGETNIESELLSVTYYNIYGQPIQVISDNHLGGQDVISSIVNFTGDLVKSVEKHIVGEDATKITQDFTYDNAKRIINIQHQINNQTSISISHNKYNELGQLRHKKLHTNIDGENPLQKIDYTYNIRGWMTSINNPTNLGNDLFATSIEYNTESEYSLLNGNISSINWSSKQFNDLKQYSFEYDALNRLTDAIYAKDDAYTCRYKYDLNGNITNLSRKGYLANSIDLIDTLVYAYQGNQLQKVNDVAPSGFNELGFNDYGINLEQEYFYDHNGNMYRDKNKGIEHISYNYLNLPTYIGIDQNQSKKIHYIYTASGSKLRKHTYDNGALQTKTDYSGVFIYENDELSFIQTSEGRLVPNGKGGFDYEYALKDLARGETCHLGNTRVMFSHTGEILQDNSYYPFGMSMGDKLTYNNTDDSPENKYLYNMKEKQTDFGLNWYDYGARFFDAEIIRFHSIDPQSEKFSFQSPFVYASNNPIMFIDYKGMGTTYSREQSQGKYMKEDVRGKPINKEVPGTYQTRYGGEITIMPTWISSRIAPQTGTTSNTTTSNTTTSNTTTSNTTTSNTTTSNTTTTNTTTSTNQDDLKALKDVLTVLDVIDDVTDEIPIVKVVSTAIDIHEVVEDVIEERYLDATVKLAVKGFANYLKYGVIAYEVTDRYYSKTINGTFDMYGAQAYELHRREISYKSNPNRLTRRNLRQAQQSYNRARKNFMQLRQ